MKILSWNVAGINSALKKGFLGFLEKESPDIFCIQETKSGQELVLEGYRQYWSQAEKKGYSGTAVFTNLKPLKATLGIGKEAHDKEGRVITLEYERFFLMDVYTPNSQRGLARLSYRMEWDRDFLAYIKALDKRKPVILCGDLNVAHEEIDLANPRSNRRNAGFTDEERKGFSGILDAGFIDTFREFEKGPGHYTFWVYFADARANNVGWRIDYMLISRRLRPGLTDAFIRKDVMGSDHCPIGIEIKDLT